MRRALPRAQRVVVDLDRPIEAVAVGPGYDLLLCVIRLRGTILGTVTMPALGLVPADLVRAAVVRRLGGRIWEDELEQRFFSATGGRAPLPTPPEVSVVVCTRDRPDDLRRCLESLALLDPAPSEVVVVDSAPARGGVEALCAGFDVTYLFEPVIGQSRARNRGIAASSGEFVAFTDDDCVVDPGWLGDLAREVGDRRVSAVTGIVLPLELETPAQWLFEAHGGHGRGFRRFVVDGVNADPLLSAGAVGVGANVVFRREALEAVGPFSEWLGPGTPAKAADDNDMFARLLDRGDRIVYSPRQLVWHRHRADLPTLSGTLRDYGLSSMAFATQRWRAQQEARSALKIAKWWLTERIPRDTLHALQRRPNRLPVSMIAAQLAGVVGGPLALSRSRRSRNGVSPVSVRRDAAPPAPRLVVTEPPSLSIVVPTIGRIPSLMTLLDRLSADSRAGLPFEVVLVLDGAPAEAAVRLEAVETPYPKVVEPLARSGIGAARNRGIERSTGDVVVFLDDDVVPHPNCLAAHAAAHAGRGLDIVLGYAPPVVGPGWWEAILRAWWEDHFRRKADPSLPLRWNDVVTLNSSFRRSALDSLGGFDPSFDRRHEDWELGVRALGQGVRMEYVAEAAALHRLDASLEGAVRRTRDEAGADVALAREHPVIGRELPLIDHLWARPARRELDLDEGLRAAFEHERNGRRRDWRRTVDMLFAQAYRAGIADALPDDSSFFELRSSVLAERPTSVVVDLDTGVPPVVPVVGAVEVALRVGGRLLGPVEPGPAGSPWDWETAFAVVRHELGHDARIATVEERLDELAEGAAA